MSTKVFSFPFANVRKDVSFSVVPTALASVCPHFPTASPHFCATCGCNSVQQSCLNTLPALLCQTPSSRCPTPAVAPGPQLQQRPPRASDIFSLHSLCLVSPTCWSCVFWSFLFPHIPPCRLCQAHCSYSVATRCLGDFIQSILCQGPSCANTPQCARPSSTALPKSRVTYPTTYAPHWAYHRHDCSPLSPSANIVGVHS